MPDFYGRYSGILGGGGGGGGGSGAAYQEVPAGVINNVNVTFTVTVAPNSYPAFELYQDGLILVQNLDYTISGTTITMTIAPNFAQTLYAVYTVVTGTSGVTDVNGISGSVVIAAGPGISVGNAGNTITITNTSPATTVLVVSGTQGVPNLITAVGGISFSGSQPFTKTYIAGNGGPVVVTANPQIAAGTVDGQELTLQGCDATNTVELQDGNGLLMNGPWIGGLGSMITFSWDTSVWVEKCRQ